MVDDGGAARYVACRGPAPAPNAEVSVTGQERAAFRFNGTAVRFVEAEQVLLSVRSVLDAPEQYAGKTVQVQGVIGRGLSLAGKTAYELRGKDGGAMVVWSERPQPASGAECVVTGEVSIAEALGRTVAVTMVEHEVAPVHASAATGAGAARGPSPSSESGTRPESGETAPHGRADAPGK